MTLHTRTFTTGRIRRADYDDTTQQLDLHRDDKTVLAYKQVPMEVFRRLCSAPNPTTYWEDRIAEEYPKGVAMGKGAGQGGSGGDSKAVRKFGDLFGGGD
ncbi:KTSC domain-containing protein [Hylemonella sp. W303a]|uniref:KTSC domain-containing protein n=1 Tax=Hylemonella sp. W303a TaxID=3389873 RepID=UPI00396B2C91